MDCELPPKHELLIVTSPIWKFPLALRLGFPHFDPTSPGLFSTVEPGKSLFPLRKRVEHLAGAISPICVLICTGDRENLLLVEDHYETQIVGITILPAVMRTVRQSVNVVLKQFHRMACVVDIEPKRRKLLAFELDKFRCTRLARPV